MGLFVFRIWDWLNTKKWSRLVIIQLLLLFPALGCQLWKSRNLLPIRLLWERGFGSGLSLTRLHWYDQLYCCNVLFRFMRFKKIKRTQSYFKVIIHKNYWAVMKWALKLISNAQQMSKRGYQSDVEEWYTSVAGLWDLSTTLLRANWTKM